VERQLLNVSTERNRLVDNIRRTFPGLPIEPLSETEAEKIARTHWRLDEIDSIKTEIQSVSESLMQAKKEFLCAAEVRSELPRLSILARWSASGLVMKAGSAVRTFQKRINDLQETLYGLEHHHGHKVSAELVRKTVSGCHRIHEGFYRQFLELQRESMKRSEEIDYGRMLVRTLKTLGDREVTLTQTVGVGMTPPPLPVLHGAEAFRLMKTPCVSIK
jgi:hypothetical protein